MDITSITALLHATATLAMGGLIWFVQVVHYPLFASIDRSSFAHYEAVHSRLTSLVVGPLMIVEVTTAVSLLVLLPDVALAWWGAGLLFLVWVSTFLVQVPQHRRLEHGFNAKAHRTLVKTNWIRTAGWSARCGIALALLASTVGMG